MTASKCPYYGFRWPKRSLQLIQVGGNECGLDLDVNGPCRMEAVGLTPDFRVCQFAEFARIFLSVAADEVRFLRSNDAEALPLKAWTELVICSR